MPFLISRVSTKITEEQEIKLKSGLGKAIELVPGKSEEYLLLGFEDQCHLYLRGDKSEPIAYIQASIFGNESHLGYDLFTEAVTELFHRVLGIEKDHIYINYTDIPDWGVAGINFDRNRYR